MNALKRFLRLPQSRNAPIVVYVLVGAIVINYLYPSTLFSPSMELGNRSDRVLDGEIWRFFTSVFVHANLRHLLLNCISLLIFGLKVERALGHWRLTAIFVLSGIMGSFISFLIGRPTVSIGASGGICGVIAASVVYYYRFRDELGQSGQKELGYAAGIALANILNGIIEPTVDNWAHAGGLFAGAVLAWLMLTQALRTGKLLSLEKPFALDSQRLLAMRLGSIFLFTSFVLHSGGFISLFSLLQNMARTNVFFLVELALPILSFVAALELWRGNLRINWLLFPLIAFETVLVVATIVRVFLSVDDFSSNPAIMLSRLSAILLNVSLIILLTGWTSRILRGVCLGVFVVGYCLVQLWLFLFIYS